MKKIRKGGASQRGVLNGGKTKGKNQWEGKKEQVDFSGVRLVKKNQGGGNHQSSYQGGCSKTQTPTHRRGSKQTKEEGREREEEKEKKTASAKKEGRPFGQKTWKA